jgi:hypothetical protein
LEELLANGPALLARQLRIRKRVREQSGKVARNLLDAHWAALSAIASATDRNSGKAGKTTAELSHLLPLTASFIQGVEICETAISEGLYFSASALLKQEMETLAAVREVREKRRQDQKTPNVKSFGALSVLYGDLNRMAHVSDKEWLQDFLAVEISAEAIGAALFTVFNEKLFKLFYALHVVFVAILAIEVEDVLKELYGEGFNELERKLLGSVVPILAEHGWMKDQT